MPREFDENGLMDRVDGDIEFLDETIGMLDEESPAMLKQIATAVADGDPDAVARAHVLKGMLANFCAEPAESAARELETLGRTQNLVGAEMAAGRVSSETGQLQAALRDFLQGKMQ